MLLIDNILGIINLIEKKYISCTFYFQALTTLIVKTRVYTLY